jgi:molecular chaperone IbpA
MNTFDFSPLFRSMIGFDRVSRLVENAMNVEDTGYPPYNIEATGENAYRITMAVAGFAPDELDVTAQENVLIVTGKRKPNGEGQSYLHRGIAARAFERRFHLADYIKVAGADLANGLLNIDLVREVPEALKPRKIAIAAGSAGPQIEQKAA